MAKGAAFSQGATLLRLWTEKEGLNYAEIGRRFGVTRACVSAWISGVGRPKTVMRARLLQLAEIPLDAWYTSDERRTLRRRPAA